MRMEGDAIIRADVDGMVQVEASKAWVYEPIISLDSRGRRRSVASQKCGGGTRIVQEAPTVRVRRSS